MLETALVLGWLTLLGTVAIGWRAVRRRERAWERLTESTSPEETSVAPVRGLRRLRRRWMWVPWVLGAVTGIVVWLFLGLSLPYVFAFGLLVGLIAGQAESYFHQVQIARLENQLADSIDIMIGAVGAGSSVGAAIDAAIVESRMPLRPYLQEISGRIRLGDEPAEVFRSLSQRVPLETFLLFTSALSVHWEVGGKLTQTLTTVARTIRDRIEISRRIRSNTAQSQFSTIAIIGLTYFIAVLVWRNGPEQMEEFVGSSVGSWFVAGSVILQAVGIFWMNQISKPKF